MFRTPEGVVPVPILLAGSPEVEPYLRFPDTPRRNPELHSGSTTRSGEPFQGRTGRT